MELGKKFSFDKEKYKFRFEIEDMFQSCNLENIHEWQDCNFERLTFNTDQRTKLHKNFYGKVRESNFLNVYHYFLKEEILPMFKEDILYQKIPTFRVQVPNNISVAEFHKDNKINTTGMTRFSVDFRILPYNLYREDDIKETVTTKTKLKLGSYFELMRYDND